MIDLSSIEGFDWDAGNVHKSLDRHGVSPIEAEQIFMSGPLLAADVGHSQQEERFQALGQTTDGRRLHVTFTLRSDGRKIRIISARDMSRKERAIYEKSA